MSCLHLLRLRNVDTERWHGLESLWGAGQLLRGAFSIHKCLEDNLDVGAWEPQHTPINRPIRIHPMHTELFSLYTT